jgi:predicted kinase
MRTVADHLVLVNGLPGSGKTTLARSLGDQLPASVLSKDEVKESLAASIRGSVPLGAIAMEMIWSLACDLEGAVIIDSFWFRPRDLEHARSGISRVGAAVAVEIWCDVPAEVARKRYARRSRHPLHRDQHRLASDWAAWAGSAVPLGLTPVVHVDTTQPVDAAGFSELVRSELACR